MMGSVETNKFITEVKERSCTVAYPSQRIKLYMWKWMSQGGRPTDDLRHCYLVSQPEI